MGGAMEIMSDEDLTVFERSTCARERQLATTAPWAFLACAAVCLVAAVVLWIVLDDAGVALMLGILCAAVGLALAVPRCGPCVTGSEQPWWSDCAAVGATRRSGNTPGGGS